MPQIRSIRFKISILYAVLLALILILYSGFLYFSVRHTLYRNIDRDLRAKAGEIISLINSYMEVLEPTPESVVYASRRVIRLEGMESPHQHNTIEKRLLEVVDKYDLRSDWIHLMDGEGKVLASSQDQPPQIFRDILQANQSTIPAGSRSRPSYRSAGPLRVINFPVHLKDGRLYILQIASDRQKDRR